MMIYYPLEDNKRQPTTGKKNNYNNTSTIEEIHGLVKHPEGHANQ
jgi:hypothetical protein